MRFCQPLECAETKRKQPWRGGENDETTLGFYSLPVSAGRAILGRESCRGSIALYSTLYPMTGRTVGEFYPRREWMYLQCKICKGIVNKLDILSIEVSKIGKRS